MTKFFRADFSSFDVIDREKLNQNQCVYNVATETNIVPFGMAFESLVKVASMAYQGALNVGPPAARELAKLAPMMEIHFKSTIVPGLLAIARKFRPEASELELREWLSELVRTREDAA